MSGQYQDLITQSAAQYGVPPALLAWQLNQESGMNPNAQTGNAAGIAQIMPATAADPGYGIAPVTDPYDPGQAIPFAAAYDAALYQQTGSWSGALNSYGTLANVPGSVTGSFNAMMTDNNISNTGGLGTSGGGGYAGGSTTSNSTLLPGGVDDYGNPTDPTNPMFPTTSGTLGAAGSALSGIPGALLKSLTGSSGQGWLQLVEELAIRVMLGLLGMVLLLAGFYVAGQRASGRGGVTSIARI